MRPGSLNYLTKEGFRNVWVNRLMSIASVSVLSSCLIMIGLAFLFVVNIGALLDSVDEQNVIVAFIDDDATETDINYLQNQIGGLDGVKDCTFISKEQGLEEVLDGLNNEVLESYLTATEEDFIPSSFEITLENMEGFDNTLEMVRTFPNISEVRENRELAKTLIEIRQSVSYLSIGAVVLLLVVSFFIIFNTVRITMLNRRLEISIMKSVGATKWFIRWPFMVEGIILGFISSGVSMLLIYGIYAILENSMSNISISAQSLSLQPFGAYVHYLLIGFIAVGTLTGVVGSVLSTKRYLKEKVYDVVEEL